MTTVRDIRFDAAEMTIALADGKRIVVPLSRYSRLWKASSEQRANWHVAGAGEGLHWPDVDEDLNLDHLKQVSRQVPGSLPDTIRHPGEGRDPVGGRW